MVQCLTRSRFRYRAVYFCALSPWRCDKVSLLAHSNSNLTNEDAGCCKQPTTFAARKPLPHDLVHWHLTVTTVGASACRSFLLTVTNTSSSRSLYFVQSSTIDKIQILFTDSPASEIFMINVLYCTQYSNSTGTQ